MNTRLISKYLQVLRQQHGFTQESLSQELNISRQAISRWERGGCIPDVEMLLKLSKLYHLSINDILEPRIEQKIEGFEEILQVEEETLRKAISEMDVTSIVKASMGASPQANALMERLCPNIDFMQERSKIERVKIDEVEGIHAQIVSLVNLVI